MSNTTTNRKTAAEQATQQSRQATEYAELLDSRNYQIENARIVKVWQSGYDKNRISIQLDQTFKSYNEKGEIVEDADTFGISINALLQQCNYVDYLALVDGMAMGKPINPQIIALVLNRAIVSVNRVFKEKGEKREFETGTYSNDCFVSKIVSIKTNIAPIFEKQINKLIDTALIVKEEVTANPWD